MLDQLQIAYPQTAKILGTTNFTDVFNAWDKVGAFHDHLQSQQERPYLADLARLEYLLYQSYTTQPIAFQLDMDGLILELDKRPQQVILEVSNSLFLLDSSYPIQEIWQKTKLDQKIDQIPISPDRYYYVINTVAESTGAYLVSPIIYKTISFMKESRKTLDQVVSKHFADSSPKELEKVLQNILSSGWIQRYRLKMATE